MNVIAQSVQVPAGGVLLDADLAVPEGARGVVLLALRVTWAMQRLGGETRLEIVEGASRSSDS